MPNKEESVTDVPPGKFSRPSKDTLNLVVAVCAVLISAASFVATYVQSEAALQEVKAETWPFLQIDHGNVDPLSNSNDIFIGWKTQEWALPMLKVFA